MRSRRCLALRYFSSAEEREGELVGARRWAMFCQVARILFFEVVARVRANLRYGAAMEVIV